MVRFEIGAMESGKRVHRLVRQLLPGVPLSGIHKMIRTGRVKRNGRKAQPNDLLDAGDVLELYMAEQDYESARKPSRKYVGVPRELDIVKESDLWLAVNKPVGLLTHGDGAEQKDTLVNRVQAYLFDRGELADSPFRPAPLNRLDRNTSGIVLFGKTSEAARALSTAIAVGQLRKFYVAIVRGQLPCSGTISGALQRPEGALRTTVAEQGKHAETKYWTVAGSGSTCVAGILLGTGRTHQIRAHFEHIGHPLWGDIKYGGARTTRSGAAAVVGTPNVAQGLVHAVHGSTSGIHQWLHAIAVQLPDGARMSAPLPKAFVDTLRRLGYSATQIQHISRFPDHSVD